MKYEISSFGSRLRRLREAKGISLNAMAKTVGVSSGYLSNVENQKTDNVSLVFLDKLESEFGFYSCPLCGTVHEHNERKIPTELECRLNEIHAMMLEHSRTHPNGVEYLLRILEHGLLPPLVIGSEHPVSNDLHHEH